MSLTREELAKSLPAHLKSVATQAMVDRINSALGDPIIAEQFRNNLVSYTSVLSDSRFKIQDYLNAVMYVTFKLLGKSDKEAYSLTFPTRWRNLAAANTTSKDIASYVSAYNRGQLVQKILQQTLTPTWVLNQPVYQETINQLFGIVTGGKSEMARVQAGNALLNALKPPETKEVNINLGVVKSDGLASLEQGLERLVTSQLDAINDGHSPKAIAEMGLVIEGESKVIA